MAIHAPITPATTRAIPLPPALAFIMGLPTASREAVERTIQAAIDALDLIDGDPDDQQDDGDTLDGNGSEDDWMEHACAWWSGPGCPLSDPGGGFDDADDYCRAAFSLDQTTDRVSESGA